MRFVNAYEMSRLAMIFFALRASYANCGTIRSHQPCSVFVTYQEKRKDDTAKKEPLSDAERDVYTTVCLVLRTTVEDLV